MIASPPPDHHARSTGRQLVSPRALLVCIVALLAAATGILWIGARTDLDLRLADLTFDAKLRVFPWRHSWLAESFGHGILKIALTILGVAVVVVGVGAPFLRRKVITNWWQMRLRFLAACAVLIPLLTSLLKQSSKSHCPWDLTRYGGTETYFRLLETVPDWVSRGKCLPAGHASTGLWLLGIVVFCLPHRPRVALLLGAAALALGGALGWLQQLRGAHFLTHTLWSLWIAAAVTVLLLWVVGLPRFQRNECALANATN
ncbi:phosphatase PAP2 family protein [Pseudoduganella violaceinigra]|uniref:phosphatase PAP2 family protein n=1 Tax=Pseudoduganella violaceinigra TaxID=246602 RepID=UPI0012B61168|nr:phosphatase PAP2 family protein [Pseudoduganella violaceinigra]